MGLVAAVQRFIAGQGTLTDALLGLSQAIPSASSGGSGDNIRVYQANLADNETSSSSFGIILQTASILFGADRGALVTASGNIQIPAASSVRLCLTIDDTVVEPRTYSNGSAAPMVFPFSMTSFIPAPAGDHTFSVAWETVTGDDSTILCSEFPTDYQTVLCVQDTPKPASPGPPPES